MASSSNVFFAYSRHSVNRFCDSRSLWEVFADLAQNKAARQKTRDYTTGQSGFELVSRLFLQFRRTELLDTAPEKQGWIFIRCFSTKDDDNDRLSDIRPLWAANSHFKVEQIRDGEKA
jgi:hypothetical protein